MKKFIIIVLIIIAIVIFYPGSDEEETEDPQACNGTMYSVAYHAELKDGLRARVNIYYVFSEESNTYMEYSHSNAGSGHTTSESGSFEGSLDDEITIGTGDNAETISFSDGSMYLDGDEYTKISLDDALNYFDCSESE